MTDEFEFEESDDWLDKIKKNDTLFQDFYSEEPKSIKINYLYVNSEKNLVNIKQEKILLTNKKIDKDNLLFLLKRHSNHNNKRYNVSNLLKYNIDIFPEDIYKFLENPKRYNFIEQYDRVKDMIWRNTINLFQDMNSLYIVYNEKNHTRKNHTRKRIFIRKDIRKNKTRKKLI